MRCDKKSVHQLLIRFFAVLAFFSLGCAHQEGIDFVAGSSSPLDMDGYQTELSEAPPVLSSNTEQGDEDHTFSKDSPETLVLSLRTEEEDDAFADDDFEDDLDIWDDTSSSTEKSFTVADPLAPWNRLMFHFNDKLYFWVLKPVAQGYKTVTPTVVRIGVKNFFQNLTTPIRMINCLFQGKFHTAETELARFLINSTAGVLGFGDIAKNNPRFAPPPEEDLGQTLGFYGIGNGIYIVWPIFGSSTLRDSLGMVGDSLLHPMKYMDIPMEAVIAIPAFETVNKISFRLGDYEALKDAAIEPYEALRDAYLQYRKKKVKNTNAGESEKRYDILINEWIK